jgi:hypothetical protein
VVYGRGAAAQAPAEPGALVGAAVAAWPGHSRPTVVLPSSPFNQRRKKSNARSALRLLVAVEPVAQVVEVEAAALVRQTRTAS